VNRRLTAFFVSCTLMVGAVTVAQAATPTKTPTQGDDLLYGTGGKDRINGLAGNDTIITGAGNDVITGGPGVDTISAGAGNDTIIAVDRTRDRISCGPGRDTVYIDARPRKGNRPAVLDSLGGCEIIKRNVLPRR
jgi:Ca2+-binding RTX toxin-like protein